MCACACALVYVYVCVCVCFSRSLALSLSLSAYVHAYVTRTGACENPMEVNELSLLEDFSAEAIILAKVSRCVHILFRVYFVFREIIAIILAKVSRSGQIFFSEKNSFCRPSPVIGGCSRDPADG